MSKKEFKKLENKIDVKEYIPISWIRNYAMNDIEKQQEKWCRFSNTPEGQQRKEQSKWISSGAILLILDDWEDETND